jgi:hypothetical protein
MKYERKLARVNKDRAVARRVRAAFSGVFRGFKLVPSKWRYLVPPQAANASRWAAVLRTFSNV